MCGWSNAFYLLMCNTGWLSECVAGIERFVDVQHRSNIRLEAPSPASWWVGLHVCLCLCGRDEELSQTVSVVEGQSQPLFYWPDPNAAQPLLVSFQDKSVSFSSVGTLWCLLYLQSERHHSLKKLIHGRDRLYTVYIMYKMMDFSLWQHGVYFCRWCFNALK